MILTADTIRELGLVEPCRERYVVHGKSAGLSYASYDLTLSQPHGVQIAPGTAQLVTVEQLIRLPNDVAGRIMDKSSWARRGILVGNTFADPGWEGYLSVHLFNHGREHITIPDGMPIAQIVFERVEGVAEPYSGKYQNQEQKPTGARYERTGDEEEGSTGAQTS